MNTFKTIFISILFCFFAGFSANAQITLTLGSQSVCNVGDSITIPVNVTGFTAVGSFSMKIVYDPSVLSFGRTLNWDAAFSNALENNISASGTLIESWILVTGPVTIADGKLFDIKFEALGGSSNVDWSSASGANEVTNYLGVPYTISTFAGGVAEQASPMPVISGTLSYCEGSNTTLDAGVYASWLWSDGSSTQTINANAGTYSVSVTDANGCSGVSSDKVVVEFPVYAVNDAASITCGDSYTLGTQTLTATGSYSETFSSVNGCDSIVTLTLTVNPTSSVTQLFTECEGFSITVGSNTYTTSGVYTDVLTASNGCDSTVITNLTINPTFATTASATICGTSTYVLGTQTLSSSGDYTEVFQSINGCDSTVTLTLTVVTSYNESRTAEICDGETYVLGAQNLTTSGVFSELFTTSGGCDSTVTLTLTVNQHTLSTQTETACDSFTWFGTTYTSSTSDTHVLTNVAGCDSTITLNLTINNSNAGTDTQIACDSYTWIDGLTYTASNTTATFTETNVLGCDSIVTLNLTINNSSTGDTTVVACDSFHWYGTTYTNSGDQTHLLTNASGCDSIVTLHLTINPIYTETASASICNGSYTFGTQTLTASGDYTEVFQSVNGCDSTVTLTLSVVTTYNEAISASICDGDSYILGTQNLTTTGVYSELFTSTTGCDSTVTLTLTVNQPTSNTQTFVECNGYSVTVGSNTYTTTGVYTDVILNVAGCDSTVTTDLTINQPSTSSQTYVECQGFSVTVGSNTYNTTGIYTDVLVNTAGCDSTVTTNLTINQPSSSTQTFSECEGFSVTVGANTYTTTGVYTDVLVNAVGCDSTVTTDLTIEQPSVSSQTFDECQGFSITVGSNTYNTTGVFTDVFTAANGCDSTVTTNLTINPTYTETASASICNGSYIFGTQTLTTSGDYTEIFQSVNGCDSTVTLTLSVVTAYNEALSASICDGDSYILGTQNLTTTGVFTELFTSTTGCDSTVTLTLTVNQPTSSIQTLVECEGFSVTVGTNTYNTTGVYTDVLVNVTGCDSTVTTNLTINQPNSSSQTFVECQGFSVTVGSSTYTSTGIYTDVLVNVAGCDSTVTTDLTINSAIIVELGLNDTLCSNLGEVAVLDAGNAGMSYLWDNSSVAQTLTVNSTSMTSGVYDYSVTVTDGVCTSTDAISLTIDICSGIEKTITTTTVNIYPNPAKEIASIISEENIEKIRVFNLLGSEISNFNVNSNKFELNTDNYVSGIYYVQIETLSNIKSMKLQIIK